MPIQGLTGVPRAEPVIPVKSPPPTSEWHRFASRVRRGIAAMRRSRAATGTVREYIRVIPVLAGQVREAASRIEHTVLEITSDLGSLVDRARRVVSARAAGTAGHAGGDVDELTASSRQALRRLHDRGVDTARRSMEVTVRIEDAISALKVISLHIDQGTQTVERLPGLIADLESNLTLAMTTLRYSVEVDIASLVHDTNSAERAIDGLGARDAAMRRELDAAARETEQLAEDVSRAAAALQCQERVDQRLQHVIETLSEMQDEFVAAIDHPQERPRLTGSAALRLRRRYTAAAVRRTTA